MAELGCCQIAEKHGLAHVASPPKWGRCMRAPAEGRRCSTGCPDYLHASLPGLAHARSGVVNVDSACRTCAVRLGSQT
ncbi:hypothetical protein CAI18_19925 [Xanthomonas citri pv. punicae]|uniref:Uncharacterized protein n=1 Tax=Xanthomonas campestris pv. malvacearum TaxID=86040 RepID=A0AA44Z467_XANCM|nr:hypothetical protein CIW71_06305 [Xanthomonas citri pv. malvacearum]NMI12504.1 hypothetical protein [Xanthomonas citri]QCZ66935.1 hypothetical protein CAI14_01240 [Xanthomonas citri pv. punicae]CCF66497.1 hypothetical protein XAPC_185 [Xanthomonas citri pv. punicae str. LMG 859]PUE96371.1 hypothetical protein C7T86_02370 [Xanthomonas citri pv. malvacearum]